MSGTTNQLQTPFGTGVGTALGVASGAINGLSLIPNANITYTGTWTRPVAFIIYNSSLFSDGVYIPNVITATYMQTILNNNQNLTSLNLGNVQNISNDLSLNMQGLTSFIADSLIQISGNFNPQFNALTTGSTLSLPALKYINGTCTPAGGSNVTLTMNSLLAVSGNFGPGFSVINATALTTIIGTFATSMNPVTLNLPSLVTLTSTMTVTFLAMTSFIATSLTSVASMVTTYTLLTNLNLPALTTITNGAFQPTAPLCTSVTVTSLSVIGTNITCSFAILTELSFPGLTFVGNNSGGTITITAPNMTTFSLGSGLLYVGGNVTLTGMKLNQASVDGILVRLAALDGTGETTAYSGLTVNLSGGTSATPSATGLAAKATLQARGCTVTTN